MFEYPFLGPQKGPRLDGPRVQASFAAARLAESSNRQELGDYARAKTGIARAACARRRSTRRAEEQSEFYDPETGATMIGALVGAGEPDCGSTVTATAPSPPRSTGPGRICSAAPDMD